MVSRFNVKPRFWIFMMVFMVFALLLANYAQNGIMAEQHVRLSALEGQRSELVAQKAVLDRRLQFVQTDTYIRRAAHDMDLVGENETLYSYARIDPS